ncbi:MAG: DUF3662 and FHA domain-containing protein [Nocardioidaceae bacterium]
MGALNRFEQRLEHLVTGAFARAFRSAVQPMEIAAALQREVDNSVQILSRERRLAPNCFAIDLSATDFDRLSTYGETLSRELASMLHEHAAEQHYLYAGPVQLNFTRADDLSTGRFRVRSRASAEVTPVAGQSMTDTAVNRSPLFLEINGVRHPLEPPSVVIGRGTNADLRIDDPGISRRHVEFRLQSGAEGVVVSVLDLGSTNGTTVNGRRVQQSPLADGAVVQIGSTRIVVRAPQSRAPAPSSAPSSQPKPASAPWQQSQRRQPAPQAGQGASGTNASPPPSPRVDPPPRAPAKRSRFDKRHKPPFRVAEQPPPVSHHHNRRVGDRCPS